MLRLLASYALQLMGDDWSRHKVLVFDEAWMLLGDAAGRALVSASNRLCRSQNATPILATQILADVSELDNLIGALLCFGVQTDREARHALELLGLDADDERLRSQLQSFRKGRCFMRDYEGRVAPVQIDPVDPAILACARHATGDDDVIARATALAIARRWWRRLWRAPTTRRAAPRAPRRSRLAHRRHRGRGTRSPASYADPLSALGAASPTCRSEVSARGRRNCRSSGAVEHRYPLSSYGFDVQVGFSITHMQDSFLGALQSIAALIWMALVYLVKGVMLLLEWAFSLDLLGATMSRVRATLNTLHTRVIGQPWFLAAISVVGLWGIWRGLVQRQTTQTLGALLATVGLMLCALVVLARPDDTVGYASHLANEASIGILAAATASDVDHPRRALSDAMIGVFDTTVRDPWCALEFGSVDYCHEPAKGSSTLTNADVWLAFPRARGTQGALQAPQGRGPERRQPPRLRHQAPAQPCRARRRQAPDGARRNQGARRKEPRTRGDPRGRWDVPRFALLGLIAVGMTGTVALLAYLGIRLLLAAILALLLLLFTPAMLLAPAFGESGRATFIAWAHRLIGAIAAKLIYALFLAIVLVGAAALRGLEIGWFGTWLLQIAFWWGVL